MGDRPIKKQLILGVTLVAFLLLGNVALYGKGVNKKDQFKVIESKNMKDHKESQMDINTASKEEMIAHKVTMKVANGIIDYRDITGGINDISELKRIKGIGGSTYNTICKKFKVVDKIRKHHFNINKANEQILVYYGFTKSEIKDINKYIKTHGRIRNNIELMGILSKKRYEEYKSLVIYENFNY